jgi:hypothetical protein
VSPVTGVTGDRVAGLGGVSNERNCDEGKIEKVELRGCTGVGVYKFVLARARVHPTSMPICWHVGGISLLRIGSGEEETEREMTVIRKKLSKSSRATARGQASSSVPTASTTGSSKTATLMAEVRGEDEEVQCVWEHGAGVETGPVRA